MAPGKAGVGGDQRPERRGPRAGAASEGPQCNEGAGACAGLPRPRPRLGGSADHPRLPGGANDAAAPRRGARTPRRSRLTKTGPPRRATGSAVSNRASRQRTGLVVRQRNRAHRPAARPACPRGPSRKAPHPGGREAGHQSASSAPLDVRRHSPPSASRSLPSAETPYGARWRGRMPSHRAAVARDHFPREAPAPAQIAMPNWPSAHQRRPLEQLRPDWIKYLQNPPIVVVRCDQIKRSS